MKKLFRFKYEECNGTCYAYQEIFFTEMKVLSSAERGDLISIIVKAHDNLCDNPDYYFGIDLCEETNLFVGHFIQPIKIDIFTGKTLQDCVLKLCNTVIETPIPIIPGLCEFGRLGTENLALQIKQACAI